MCRRLTERSISMYSPSPCGVETPPQGADGPFHSLDPTSRQSILITLIVKRNDLVAQYAIEIFSVASVVHVQVGMRSAGSDSEAVEAVIGLGPPTIENGEVETAVEHYLLSTDARCLKRAA